LIVILSVLGAGIIGAIVVGIIDRTQSEQAVVTTTEQTENLPEELFIMPGNRQGQAPRIMMYQQFQEFRQEQREKRAASAPLSVDEAKKAVDDYLTKLNNPDLKLKEVIVFENNAYASIVEKSTGTGAFELLVMPGSLRVVPEYSANMMWNLKYSMMAGGVMMKVPDSTNLATPFTMTVTAEEAAKLAQDYLDAKTTGFTADKNPQMFYGYYTIDILKDGQPVGLLSVNGSTGRVILHTWHGSFVSRQEY